MLNIREYLIWKDHALEPFWLNSHNLKYVVHLFEVAESYPQDLKIKYISVDNWTKLVKYFGE